MADPVNTQEEEATQPVAGGQNNPDEAEIRVPWWAFAVFLALAILVLALLAWSLRSTLILFIELMVAAASASVGALLGFLFGMPRAPLEPSPSNENKGASTDVTYRPSNNLEQVSDWLTKILIGVGLVELTKLRGALRELGSSVATSIAGTPTGTNVVTEVVVVTFVVLGFLVSFLWTRIYYGRLQTLADNDIINRLRGQVRQERKEKQQEREEKEKARKVVQKMRRGEIPENAATRPADRTRAQKPEGHAWNPGVLEKIEEFENLPKRWDNDPGATFFGRLRQEDDGRRLEAEMILDVRDALMISLRVRRVSGKPLEGTVAFLLHPTFNQPVVYAEASGEVAEVTISSAGWFTAVAIADGGDTKLAYNLSELPGAPAWFKRN